MIDRNRVHEGMVVYSSEGRKLGRVLDCREGTFVIEKGFYFTTDYVARYDDVTGISGDEIRLARPEDSVPHGDRAFKREGALGESFTYGVGAGLSASPMAPWGRAEAEEAAVRGGSVRGDEDEGRSTYEAGGRNLPHCCGDEGGGGWL